MEARVSAYRINDLELSALAGAGAEIAHLYLVALRPRMDFRTGVVGRVVRISYQALREWTERTARRGVRYLAHDKSKLQRMLAQLEKLGLLRRLGGQYELVFACPLADTDSCVQKKARRGSIHPQDGYEFSADAGFKDVPESVDNAKAATHPYSGNTYKTNPPNPPRRGREKKEIESPTPAAREDRNGPQHRRGARRHRLSEQRGQSTAVVGDGPAAQRPESEEVSGVAWQADLAWPVDMGVAERARVARIVARAPLGMRQVVIDEWWGRMAAGGVDDPFAMLAYHAKRAADPDWVPSYAPAVRESRERARALRLQQEEALARLQAQAEQAVAGLPWHAGRLRRAVAAERGVA
jgi:hypothetical protein